MTQMILPDLVEAFARKEDLDATLGKSLTRCVEACGMASGALYRADLGLVTLVASCVRGATRTAASIDSEVGAALHTRALELGRAFVISEETVGAPLAREVAAQAGGAFSVVAPFRGRGSGDASDGFLLLTSLAAPARPTRFLAQAQHLSERLGHAIELRQTFARLSRSEVRYRGLLESAKDGIGLLTRDGHVIDCNPGMCQILGVPLEQQVGRHISSFMKAQDVGAQMADFARNVAAGRGEPQPIEIRRPDGAERLVEFSVAVATGDPEPVVFVVARDVTEQREIEAQLLQAQKMETFGQLAGGIAHDFNNLMVAVIINSDLVYRDLPADSPLREDVDEIRKAGNRAASLTRQLLAFSRKQVLEPRILDLNVVVHEMEKLLRRTLGEDVELLVKAAPDLGRVLVDPGQMEQVLLNLAVNARDAMAGGGQLVITTGNVVVEEDAIGEGVQLEEGAYVVLTVSDSGAGMSAATRARIFEPFFTTKGVGKGTGLGLSTCYGIVRQSGGQITVDSQPGVGTVFKIYLPRVFAAARHDTHSLEGTSVRGDETILLVEDDDAVRAGLRRILEKNGYHVLVANGGDEALSVCRQSSERIDLVLTDVVMPGRTGPEVAEAVRAVHAEARVLYMSGFTDHPAVLEGVAQKGLKFVQKPFSAATITMKIREVLRTA